MHICQTISCSEKEMLQFVCPTTLHQLHLPIPPVMFDRTVGGTGVNPVWKRATVAVYCVLFNRSELVGGSTTPLPVTAGAKAGIGT